MKLIHLDLPEYQIDSPPDPEAILAGITGAQIECDNMVFQIEQ